MTATKSISPQSLHATLSDGVELAPIDVREELAFSQRHLLWARNVPLSRLELRFARLVPRHGTRVVLMDDGGGLSRVAALEFVASQGPGAPAEVILSPSMDE